MSKPVNNKIYIGIDNGTSSCGIAILIPNKEAILLKTPTKKCLNYQKEAKHITRIDVPKLQEALGGILNSYPSNIKLCIIERPLVNPMRFNASLSAVRSFEANLISVEALGLSYQYIDSKEWQKALLPKNLFGSEALKEASLQVGMRLFPHLKLKKDADSLLMAEYARRNNL
jgi:hypothetical protein